MFSKLVIDKLKIIIDRDKCSIDLTKYKKISDSVSLEFICNCGNTFITPLDI
jgi:hypothetical protein